MPFLLLNIILRTCTRNFRDVGISLADMPVIIITPDFQTTSDT
jgi:hypothetical protein